MAKRGEIFQTAPVTTPNTSWFDMSSDNLLSCNAGKLIPHNIIECMPGDHIKGKTHVFGRVAPMLAPTFGKVDIMTYDFFVRSRDIWQNFDEFITNQDQDDSRPNYQGTFVAPASPKFSFTELVQQTWLAQYENYLYETLDHNLGVSTEDSRGLGYMYVCPVLHIRYDKSTRQMSSELFMPGRDSLLISGPTVAYPLDESNDVCNWYILLTPSITDREAIQTAWSNYRPDLADNVSDDIITLHECKFSQNTLLDYLGADFTAWFKEQQRLTIQDCVNATHSQLGGVHEEEYVTSLMMQHTDALLSRQVISVAYFYENDVDARFDRWTGYVGYGEPGLPQLMEKEYRSYSLLPLYAYAFIYNDYFRDQNYIPKLFIPKFTDGVIDIPNNLDVLELFSLRNKAYMHDPYTSALPAPQRGQAVRFLADASFRLGSVDSTADKYPLYANGSGANSSAQVFENTYANPVGNSGMREVLVDLSAATIENFRWANAMQRYLEAVNRTGGRYFEYIFGIFGKEVPDSKINRPIYLNGNRTPLQISEVLQTGSTDLETQQPLGDMAGRGIVIGSDDSIDFECPDWGFFIQLAVVVPRTSYMTGMNPIFERETYLD